MTANRSSAPKDRLNGRKTLNRGFYEELEADEIKKKVDLAEVIGSFGIRLEKKGASLVGLCPFHGDHENHPNLSVTPENGLYHCFRCHAGGDVFTFVEKMKGLSFTDTLKYLAGKEYVNEKPVVKESSPDACPPLNSGSPVPEPPVEAVRKPEFDPARLSEVVDWWQKKLSENKEARDYLTGRGFTDASLWTRFKIGYADGSLPTVLSEEQKKDLIAAGVLTKRRADGSPAEHFYGCVVFPMLDENDRVTGIYGRKVDESASIWHLYLKGQHKGVFNRKASKVYDEIILTESLIDALSLIQLGFENVQALYGVGGFTAEHKQLLRDDRVKTVILAFDNDPAGKEGAERYTPELVGQGFAVKVIAPPLFKDWNEALQQNLTKETVQNLIAEAPPFMPKEAAYRLTVEQGRHRFDFGDLSYVLLGVPDIFVGSLKMSARATRGDETFYDTLEFFSARSRTTYANGLARSFAMEPKRIEKDLLDMLKKLEAERDRKLSRGAEREKVELTEEERALGLAFLKSPTLLADICRDMETLGYVGDDLNKRLLYLCATSRKLDDPISVIVVSESASGKSFLIETVEKLMPPEETLSATSLSKQALNYLPIEILLHVFLTLGEAVHDEEVEHQIREILSGKRLSRLVTFKDEKTGEMVGRQVAREAIAAIAMSTTGSGINPENASRCFLVSADESREQTRKIHELQRRKYSGEGSFEKERDEVIRKHRAAQRLLRPVRIVCPYAGLLRFPEKHMRSRRDHGRFLDLIAAVCFLRQYQKEEKQDASGGAYIEADIEDYRAAWEIMTEKVFSATLSPFSQADKQLYESVRELARKRAEEAALRITEVVLTQREIREYTEQHPQWVKQHLRKLYDLEYLTLSGTNGRGSRYGYRLTKDEDLNAVDLQALTHPDELAGLLAGEKVVQPVQSGTAEKTCPDSVV